MEAYKKNKGDWSVYERDFMALLEERTAEKSAAKEIFDGGCLLCSEPEPDRCHRRLVAEYLSEKWGDVEVAHI